MPVNHHFLIITFSAQLAFLPAIPPVESRDHKKAEAAIQPFFLPKSCFDPVHSNIAQLYNEPVHPVFPISTQHPLIRVYSSHFSLKISVGRSEERRVGKECR